MEERLENYTIAEGYTLPSKGLIYDKPVNAQVELRSMTAREEMKRSNPTSTPYKTLADIIETCMIEKPAVHVYDMALADYEYLLHKLRVVTYGPNYKVYLTCPFCGETFDAELDLDSLEVKEFDPAAFEELRTFELPKCKKQISLKFQTPHMLDTIESKVKDLKRRFKEAELSFEIPALLTSVIDTVDGEKLDSSQLETFVNKLPAMDMTKIINNIDKLNACLGINNEFYLSCTKCGGEVKSFFRFGSEFFRPTNI